MAKQLNLLSGGQIVPTALHQEMQQSYLEYAMSVIVGRALPDVRDGLKPVHRRIIYAMHELGLTPERPYRKCARVVGDVLGKYHPHGDQSVYDALVRLVQDFSSRYPLLAGHGNFGSIDNDPPAAMRYTETRLGELGNQALLSEIGTATVDFTGNFDNSQQEPVVLPAQLPILLLNGSSGIAVGMATNIPPHNLGELVDGLIALIDRPTLSDDKLLELIPGPDFPTGGEIIGIQGIRDAYLKGRGSITVRGVVGVETVQTGKTRRSQRPALIVSEFPFQVSKSSWIEKLAQLVNQGKIDAISDIRDESDRAGIRVVIELKREASPQKVLKQIYRLTALQNTFGVIMLSLVDNQPRQLTLRETLQAFLDFREQTLTRQYQDELDKIESRLHLLSGLLKALDHLDAVIDILRHAPDGTTAKAEFQSRLDFSEQQANAILAMPMRRLTGMERDNLKGEFEELNQRRQVLQGLLGDRHELLKSLKKELRQLKRKFGDERRTRIVTADGTVKSEAVQFEEAKKQPLSASLPLDLKPQAEAAVLEITQRGYGRRLLPKNVTPIEGVPPQGQLLEITEDFPLQQIPSQTDRELLMFVRDGKVYSAPIGEIAKLNGRNDRGQPLVGLLPPSAQGDPDAIVAQFVADEVLQEKQVVFLTQAGRIKRLPFADMTNITARGLTVLKFKGDDGLHGIEVAQPGQQAIVASSGGRLLRMPVDDEQLPVLGRTAQGYQAVRLRKTESIAGLSIVEDSDELVLITERGYCKRLAVTELRLGERGAIGTQGLRFANASDRLLAIVRAIPGAELVLHLNGDRLLRLPMSSLKSQGKDGTGQRPKLIKSKDTVISTRICLPTEGE
ncbi:DNA gyrase/topoisomerase IV subunit A [Sodalinema gerasimenkoae]|uniref:DNA gyrase/topoisomerase IV subunit A n=1 Tax=Sodalinema gerasimenkoae TaxID=2862348 RepID=UPI0013574A4E|nr:DNA topoisomerase (ATP-hydrolyzing) [Sodalinema gerasimenkoae]